MFTTNFSRRFRLLVAALIAVFVASPVLLPVPVSARVALPQLVPDDVKAINGQEFSFNVLDNDNLFGRTDLTVGFEFNTPLPPGLEFQDGVLSGTPVQNGVYTFTYFVAADNFGVVSTQASVTVVQPAGTATVTGQVVGPNGPAQGAIVDLFSANADGTRGQFISSYVIEESPRQNNASFFFQAPPGCYILTFVSPFRSLVWVPTLGQYVNRPVCVRGGEEKRLSDTRLGMLSGSITGKVSDEAGQPVAGVVVDLFDADRTRYIGSVKSNPAGELTFSVVSDGCYTVTFVAPTGYNFVDGGKYLNDSVCAADDPTTIAVVALSNR